MDTSTPLGIKQAALVLHGLAPADCDWMLSHLPPHQHQALRHSLQELKTLGIPRDAVLTQTAAAAAPDLLPQGEPGQEALAAATAVAVMHALDGQPPAVVRAALQLQGAWQEKVRTQLGVSAGLDEPTARLGAAFRTSLAAAITRRLPHPAPSVAEPKLVQTQSRIPRWWSAITRRSAT